MIGVFWQVCIEHSNSNKINITKRKLVRLFEIGSKKARVISIRQYNIAFIANYEQV